MTLDGDGLQRPRISSAERLTPATEDPGDRDPHLARRPRPAPRPVVPDLIIAATAELAGLTLLQLDKDFDLIVDITRQRLERLKVSLIPR